MLEEPLLNLEKLTLHFKTERGIVQAVDGIDFSLPYNRAVVILGESGCGKSSLAKAILRLLPRNVHAYAGKVSLNGMDVMGLSDETYRRNVRWAQMSLVPQAAMNALNPVLKVGRQVSEPAIVHQRVSKEKGWEMARAMFQLVGVPIDFVNRYAFELSGGMRQRVAIAMALITSPNLVILDEPTSALDVLTQANIFNVLKRIKKEMGVSFMLITHDIATSSELADDVAVMYAGQIVEISDARRFFQAPLHPYSQKLMASVPRLNQTTRLEFITGQPPSLINPPQGCRFAERCHLRMGQCDQEPPTIHKDGRQVKCWLHG
jgi:peptide/nickel transport system ATP-binding protein